MKDYILFLVLYGYLVEFYLVLFFFPLIFHFKIIPDIEKKINKKPMYIQSRVYPRFMGKIPRVMWHIIIKYWLSKNGNALFNILKKWSGYIDKKTNDDLLLYNASLFSRFEVFVSFMVLVFIWFCMLSFLVSIGIKSFYFMP